MLEKSRKNGPFGCSGDTVALPAAPVKIHIPRV